MKMTVPFLFLAVALIGTAAQAFEAYDDGEDAKYVPAESWLRINGGSGYTEWTRIDGSAQPNAVTTDFRDGSYDGSDNWGDFTLGVSGGDVVVGRNFVDGNGTVVLGTGTFTVRGWLHSDAAVEFLGFSVLDGSNNELLRWGQGTDKDGIDGIVYRAWNGDYILLERDGSDGFVDFTLSWERGSTGLAFTLAGTDAWGNVFDAWSANMPISVAGAESVGGIAVVAGGGSQGAPAKMAFDQVSVTGVIVPEPGTLGLLAAGAALVAGWRRKKG